MGNVTVAYDSVGRPASFGNKRVVIGTITMSAAYAVGGDTILAADRKFGLAALDRVVFMGTGFDPSGKKHIFMGFDSETAPTKVLATWGDNTNAASSASIEASGNLTAYKATFMAIGA